jgi:hypothetical protein
MENVSVLSRREEWLGLAERHPNEFARAVEMEKQEGGKGYTWIQGMTLDNIRNTLIIANKFLKRR